MIPVVLGTGCAGCTVNTAGTDCNPGMTTGCSGGTQVPCAGSAAFLPASQGPGKPNHIGFGDDNCPTANLANRQVKDGTVVEDTSCDVNVSTYEMGVYGHISGDDFYGVSLTHEGVISNEHEDATATAANSNCS